jgi:hypothetical protein
MKSNQYSILIVLVIFSAALIPMIYATPSVQISMDKTTFRYCEKLFYTIKVSEVTGDSAIIHIRDNKGGASSAISIPISNLQNSVPSMAPFEAEIFPLGKYFIDVEYSGAKNSTEFDLIDSENICIPTLMKQISLGWVDDKISDGFWMDAIERYVDKELINVPDTIKEKNLEDIQVPKWMKTTVNWWIDDKISDSELSQAIQYLIDTRIIVI